MNSNFDLNLNNYTIIELEELFELPPNYDETIIEIKETKLRQHIISDKNVISSTKTNTLDFINKVKKKLCENINKNINNFKNIYNLDKTLDKSNTIDAGSTYIIEKPTTPYTQSSPSEFYPGTINPLNKRILKKNINIDTRFRENYYTTLASNFHVNLPLKLSKVVSLQLSAIELPNTFYVISQIYGNNFFVLEIVNEEPLIVTIPDGNYDYIGIQNFINNFLSTQSGNYPNIQFLIDINTGGDQSGSAKMVVGSTTGTTIFSINFVTDRYGNDDKQTPLPLKIGWLIGFRDGYYENNTTYVSEGLVNLLGPRYIYLAIDDFNNSVLDGFYGTFNSSIINKNILARISLQGNAFGNSFNILSKDNFSLITTPRQYFGPVDIQKLQIQLLDEYGRILNLNNMDYSFCLTFQTIYEL